MDLRMPGMDGAEAIAILKDDPATQHIPVIALSAGNVLLDHIERLRADSVVGKPFDVDLLLAGVALQLQKASAAAPPRGSRNKGTGRLSPLPEGAEPAGHQLMRLLGDGSVYQDDTCLAAVRYDLHLRTELVMVGDERVEGETTITGTIRSLEEVLLPAGTKLILRLEDGRELGFITTGSGPEYAVLPVGDMQEPSSSRLVESSEFKQR